MSIVDIPSGLTFAAFSFTNILRHVQWPRDNGNKPPQAEWSLSDWGIAAAEEMGEVCGAIKRLNRMRAGHIINGKPNDVKTVGEAMVKLQKEIGDTITYLDLLAQEAGFTLEECVRVAFNGVSEREGLPHRV